VLSDGDGNPRGRCDSSGNWSFTGTLNSNAGLLSLGGGNAPSVFRTDGNGSGFHFSTNCILPVNETGSLSDNSEDIGTGTWRWRTIYAGTGTINTSDVTEKQDIQDLTALELEVAKEIKSLIKTFRWKDAVASKGDSARIHVGVMAQDVYAAFQKHGLDAARYGLWCQDDWYEVDGKTMDENSIPYTAEAQNAVKRTRYGVRYDQLLAFVIAAL
jgi:hypothetical protein